MKRVLTLFSLLFFTCSSLFPSGKGNLLNQLLISAHDFRQIMPVMDVVEKSQDYKYIPVIFPLPPSQTKRITSRFGYRRDPKSGKSAFHSGVDLAADKAVTVHASADGVICFSGVANGYGNLIIIRHKFGFCTFYGHMSFRYKYINDTVHRGQIIGFVGSTGKSTGNHLHFEVRKNGRPINPFFLNV